MVDALFLLRGVLTNFLRPPRSLLGGPLGGRLVVKIDFSPAI